MSITLNASLRKEYEQLFDSCVISGKKPEVEAIRAQLVANQARYAAVEAQSGVPWHVTGVFHSLEGGLDFSTHLHNGDPLFDNMTSTSAWTLAFMLFKLEGFNGFGYRTRHPEVLTPYLWSYSNHYTKGKYAADGKFNKNAVSRQCGAATILHLMTYEKIIDIPRV